MKRVAMMPFAKSLPFPKFRRPRQSSSWKPTTESPGSILSRLPCVRDLDAVRHLSVCGGRCMDRLPVDTRSRIHSLTRG